MIPIKPTNATWTDEQWRAIYQDGSNIIVSAGAGSGKTAVLTERIIEKLKQGISISSLVVLTFTKAAAFEMKARVRKKLKEQIKNGHIELEKELEQVDSASITTFDSYSLSLVKKYHYLLGISKQIDIADNIVLEKKKRELLNEVFEEFYEKKDPLFLKLLDTFTIKDDEKIKRTCLTLNKSLETLAHKQDYLNNYLEINYMNEIIDKRIEEYESILKIKKDNIFRLLEELNEKSYHPVSIEFTQKVIQNFDPLLKCEHYDDYREFILGYKTISFTRSTKIDEEEKVGLQECYEKIKKQMEKLKLLCLYNDRETLKKSILNTKDTISILISLLTRFDEKVLEYKRKNNMYEFSDIARLAIELLEKNPNICNQMKENIKEIMIDEYQDTNDIGDYFISLISNHNVYMVGDIKQSIYRFRNANPSIFMDKYNRYSNHQDGEKIDLNKNFRSRREVLEDINFIFEKIMDEEIGGADYSSGHAMVFGNNSYEEKGKTTQNNHFEILNYEYKNTEISKKYRTTEIEPFMIAFDIKEKVENHYQVYDKDNKILRDIRYSDFSILLDRKSSFDLYRKIFTFLEIPLTIHKDEDFAYSDEIFIIQNIMKWILSLLDYKYAKDHLRYAVASISRSVLGNFNDEELFSFLTEHKENLLSGLNDEHFKINEIQKKMLSLAHFSKTHTLSELLEEIYQVFDIYHQILHFTNIELLNIKLDYLLDVTRNLEKMGYQIEDFIDYLKEAMDGEVDVTFQMSQDSSNNSVNVMTIHKSKGLEYHICYYAGLQKQFSKADLKEKFLFSNKYGFVVPYFEEGIRETFYKELVKENYQKEDVSERLRVFYVALTRAKEKMILVANLSDVDADDKLDANGFVDSYTRLSYQSFYDILVSIKSKLIPYMKEVSLEDIRLTKSYEQIKENNFKKTLHESKETLDYITLTLEKERIEQNHFSESYHMIDKEEQKRLELGIKLHECLQYVDYKNINSSIDKFDLSNFEKKKITAFFEQPFWNNFESPEFYPELEFMEKDENTEFHGIIDLLVVDKNYAYIIDYKLKHIDKDSYDEQVKGYMKVISKKLGKPVKGILYSIFDETYREVKM